MIVDLLFGIDIFIEFITAYYDDDFQIVDNIKEIMRNYILGWFLLDLLAIIPFDIFTPKQSSNGSTNIN